MYGDADTDHAVSVDPRSIPVGDVVGGLCGAVIVAFPGRPGEKCPACQIEVARRTTADAVTEDAVT
jgi:hypothetical protein